VPRPVNRKKQASLAGFPGGFAKCRRLASVDENP